MTELMARPLLNLPVPELAGFAQPLAGEIAARRDAARADPVPRRLRRRDRDADRRAGAVRARRPRRGRPRHAPEPPPGAARPRRDGLRGAVAASRRLLGEEAVEALAPGPHVQPGAAPHEVGARDVGVEERPALASLRAAARPLSA